MKSDGVAPCQKSLEKRKKDAEKGQTNLLITNKFSTLVLDTCSILLTFLFTCVYTMNLVPEAVQV